MILLRVTKEDVEKINNLLGQLFRKDNVIPEWDVAKNSMDAYTRSLYCPRVDFAVGPFNIDANVHQNQRLINEMYEKHMRFIEQLKSKSDKRSRELSLNKNPRCFLAIEIENKTSRKHRLGSLVNASVLGKVGIILAWNPKVFQSFVKILNYLEYAESVGKQRYGIQNALIVEKEDFFETCELSTRT